MTKHIKKETFPYTQAERQAEAAIDAFLQNIRPSSSQSILDQLRSMS